VTRALKAWHLSITLAKTLSGVVPFQYLLIVHPHNNFILFLTLSRYCEKVPDLALSAQPPLSKCVYLSWIIKAAFRRVSFINWNWKNGCGLYLFNCTSSRYSYWPILRSSSRWVIILFSCV
jgi:hypothetical protein